MNKLKKSQVRDNTPDRVFNTEMDIVSSEVIRPVISNRENYVTNTDSLHLALRPIIIMAQCFGLFPVSGINSPDTSHLRFKWKSFKILYNCIVALSVLVLTVYSVHRLTTTNFSSNKTTDVVFYATTGMTSMLFLKLAKKWPSFATNWESIERELSVRHPRNNSRISLSLRFKIISSVVMTLALLEHGLSILSGIRNAKECTSLVANKQDFYATYFVLQFPQMLSRMSYSLWKALIAQLVNLLSTFSWNFIDLFLILISDALTDQFRRLNRRLYAIRGKRNFIVKAMPEWWWTEARMDYNRLASLTRRVDVHMSEIVLLSFSTNLYFICIQLLHSFKVMSNAVQTTYFCFSFGFLLTRTTAVSLYAAAIHDESLLPAPVLYSVSANNYSPEITRFLTQVTTDNISLTGLKFFSITRSLVLTVAGTIVTYELVLVQFNAVQQIEQSNFTMICDIK